VKSLLLASLALVLGAGVAAADQSSAAQSKVTLRAQLGIIYAQNGQRDEARQEFVKLMEEPLGRPAALTNLGNLSFLDGKVDDALESYKQASMLDAKDPGILLDEGLALKELGRVDEADKVISAAVQMAGGVEKASYLLALPSTAGDADTERGKVSKMTADEVRQMLLKTKTDVPKAAPETKNAENQPKVTSRPGGARAADVSVGDQNLYWKDR
jgi:Tfp pilus assembly protein PilF